MNKEEAMKILQHYLEMEEFNNAGDFLIAIDIVLNLIQKQEKIIDMAMELISRKVGSRIEICPDMNCCEETVGKRTCKQCAKEYFKKEVEKECEK